MNNGSKFVYSKVDHRDEETARLSKRLCYILRYGAVKEGLHVDDAGILVCVYTLHQIQQIYIINLCRHEVATFIGVI